MGGEYVRIANGEITATKLDHLSRYVEGTGAGGRGGQAGQAAQLRKETRCRDVQGRDPELRAPVLQQRVVHHVASSTERIYVLDGAALHDGASYDDTVRIATAVRPRPQQTVAPTFQQALERAAESGRVGLSRHTK